MLSIGYRSPSEKDESGAPLISIIVPTYNAAETLEKLLVSIEASASTDHEVIIVDDGSSDGTTELLTRYSVRVLRTPRNGGPSLARNMGARVARGDILLFLDSDVILREDSLAEVFLFFEQHPDRSVMIGVYDSEPANQGAWPLYKALQCYSYYRSFPPLRRVSLLWAAVAAFRKDVFLRSGGFDIRFNRPSMEDLELGRRISAQHPIYLNRNVVVKHHFPVTLRQNVLDHFHRGRLWVKIYFRYKRFDDYLSTPRRAIGRLAAFASIPSIILAQVLALPALVAAAPLAVYLACNYDLWAVTARRKPRFLPAAFAMDFFLGTVLGAALCRALLDEGISGIGRLIRRRNAVSGSVVPIPEGEEGMTGKTATGSTGKARLR